MAMGKIRILSIRSIKHMQELWLGLFLFIYTKCRRIPIFSLPTLGRLLAYLYEEKKAHWVESCTDSLSFCRGK